MPSKTDVQEHTVQVQTPDASLDGHLALPENASGMVVFAHGSGSSRMSPRNRHVAQTLNDNTLATLLFDLLTVSEERADQQTRELRFDLPLLARRLTGAIDWIAEQPEFEALPMGLFGASTGAAAALMAAARRPDRVAAVVSRGGRPDLADAELKDVRAPTLLIVGGNDTQVIELNERAAQSLTCHHRIELVAQATHLFSEPGKLEEVARLASGWFLKYLANS